MTDFARIIKDSVTMRDVVIKYCTSDIRHDRIRCPFHNGKNYNLAIYDDSYFCFVCHEHGDIVDFTRNILGVTFVGALDALNRDFHLGLKMDGLMIDSEKSETNERIRKLKEKKEKERAEKAARQKTIDDYWDELIECEKIVGNAEPLSDEWVKAKKRLQYLEYIRDTIPAR